MSEDTYVAGALTLCLHGGAFDSNPTAAESARDDQDAVLASLFAPRVPKKRRLPPPEDAEQPRKQRKKPALSEVEEARAAVKARSKLVKQREQARQTDPRNSRTVFVGNVPSAAKKRELLLLFREHGPIESARFRGAAPADAGVVKRLAVIHKKLSRPSLNAYVVFKEQESVAKAVAALNGHCLLGLHLRVDGLVAGDAGGPGLKKDVRKCVFLGNLHFKCDEESVRAVLSPCGRIDNVRLVRDSRSGIGRGFGFVQFADSASVELALKLGGAEIAGRPVRITRCSEHPKPASAPSFGGPDARNPRPKKAKRQQRAEGEDAKPRPSGRKPDMSPAVGGKATQGGNARNRRPQQASRPTNRTFAEAFQRMADKRKATTGRKKTGPA